MPDPFREHVDKNKKREIVLYRLGEMEYIPWENHPGSEQDLRVLAGEIVVDVGTETHTVEHGGTAVISRNTLHRVSAVGPAVILSTYTPPIVFDEDHAATYDILDLDIPEPVWEHYRSVRD